MIGCIDEHRSTYGVEDIAVARCTVERLMRRLGLQGAVMTQQKKQNGLTKGGPKMG